MPFFEFSLMSQIQKLILCVEYFLMTKTSRNLWYCRTVQFIKIHFGYRSVHCTVFPNLRRMNVWTYCTWYSLKINANISCDLKRNFQNIYIQEFSDRFPLDETMSINDNLIILGILTWCFGTNTCEISVMFWFALLKIKSQ